MIVHWMTKPLPYNWGKKIEDILEKFSLGLLALKSYSALVKMIFQSVLIWILTISAFYPLMLAYNIQNKSLLTLILLRIVVSIMIVVLPTPAYLGSFNAGIFIVLHEILGESEVIAASFGLVAWAMNTFVIFFAGLFFILREYLPVYHFDSKGDRKLDTKT